MYVQSVLNVIVCQTNWICPVCLNVIVHQTNWVCFNLSGSSAYIPGSTILCRLEMACYSPDEYSLSDLLNYKYSRISDTQKKNLIVLR